MLTNSGQSDLDLGTTFYTKPVEWVHYILRCVNEQSTTIRYAFKVQILGYTDTGRVEINLSSFFLKF